MSGYSFVAISLHATIVISFVITVVVVVVVTSVELRLPSSIGCRWCASVELLVVRLSWDVLADTRVRDAWLFMRATL